MLMSEWAMGNAAAQLRSAEAAMSNAVASLQSAQTWSGADADRFQRDWDEQVRGKLRDAATRLDVAIFSEAE